MMKGLWGKKLGMTQVFTDDKVVPVTVIDVSNWVITNIRTQERDGYNAVQIGCIKKKYSDQSFAESWLKEPTKYFNAFKEVKSDAVVENVAIGQMVDFHTLLQEGDKVDIIGKSKGCGFTGVVKRYNFAGGPRSHGSAFGRLPGSLSFMRSQGRVIKGKRMAGHKGTTNHMIKNLAVVKVEGDAKIILVKGAVPGKAGSLVFVRKA